MEIAAVAVPAGPAADAGPHARTSSLRAFLILVFLLGCIVNTVAYWSVAPVVVLAVTLLATMGLALLLGRHTAEERNAVLIMFVVGWFWAGVSALYRVILGYENIDSYTFHELVIDPDFQPIEPYSGDPLSWEGNFSTGRFAYEWFSLYVEQNAGVIIVWRLAYNFFARLGLGDGPYIGVTMNTAFVAFSVAMGLRIVKAIFGADAVRIRRYLLLCSTCGIFWLFASLHVRDSMALFCVTLRAMFWDFYRQKPSVRTLSVLAVATLVSFILFGLVRSEFLFVPLAMIMAGAASQLIGMRGDGAARRWRFAGLGAVLAVVIVGVMVFYPTLFEAITALLEERGKVYGAVSADEGASSLGNQLIVSQTGLIKLLVATPYLLLAPLPVWVGFFSDLAYHLYKTFNALFLYGVLPLVGLALWRMARERNLRRPVFLFAAFCFIGFAAAIAHTSLESRHLGAFYVFLMVLALVPDLRKNEDRKRYRFGLTVLMVFLVPLHLAWVASRLVT